MNEEEKRYILEKLTEEELAVFDIFNKSPDKLSKTNRDLIKKVAQDTLRIRKRRKSWSWAGRKHNRLQPQYV